MHQVAVIHVQSLQSHITAGHMNMNQGVAYVCLFVCISGVVTIVGLSSTGGATSSGQTGYRGTERETYHIW